MTRWWDELVDLILTGAYTVCPLARESEAALFVILLIGGPPLALVGLWARRHAA